jgi:molybdopterin/thiamine biosynthesis adenylyltransferase
MDDNQLLRYSRQIMLPQFDIQGQETLLQARALIIGLGGLGSPIAMYLAAAGVGHLVLVDFDRVDLSNLQRQIIHSTADIDKYKTDSARETLLALNPDIQISVINRQLEREELVQQVTQADMVIDATDNFPVRFLINDVCVEKNTPLVSGAAIRTEGQVSVFLNDGKSPCYRCLYRDENEPAATCSESGVLAPLVGIIGSIQAIEALKILTGVGEPLNGRLLFVDALTMEMRTLKLPKDPACPVCGMLDRVVSRK